MSITIKEVGNNKVEVIKVFRDITGVGLREAKDAIDSVTDTNPLTFESIIDEELAVNQLSAIGVTALSSNSKLGKFEQAVNNTASETFDGDTNTDITEKMIKNNGEDISNLSREKTLDLLVNVGKIIKQVEENVDEETRLNTKISENIEEAEKIRKKYPAYIGILSFIISLFISIIIMAFLTIIPGIIALVILDAFISAAMQVSYESKHQEEIDAKVEAFLRDNNDSLVEQLEIVSKRINDLKVSGKIDWAIDVVGEDLFYSEGVAEIYSLIKNRRADSLKEALNLYDSTQHRERMEEMQIAIQNATEIAAAESAKQTIYAQQIEKNTHEAATAAKATAYNTRQISKNTKKIKKNTRRIEKNTRHLK